MSEIVKFKDTLLDFFTFLRHPSIRHPHNPQINIFNATLLFFIVLFGGSLIYIPILSSIGIEDLDHSIEGFLESSSIFSIIMITIIAAPLIEEFLFRYPLKYPFLLLAFVVLSVGGIFLFFMGQAQNYLWIAILFVVLGVTLLLYLHTSLGRMWQNFVYKRYGYLFYWSVAVFAFMHAFNFDTGLVNWYLLPFIVLPQFFLAILLGYLRVAGHFAYAVYIHGLNNLIPITVWLGLDGII